MQIHTTIAGLRDTLAGSSSTVLVPTMGNLHEGHLALMRQARQYGGPVVATIFVNRLQFRPGEDFERYPRTLEADCGHLRAAGVDHLFAPDEGQMYPRPQTFHIDPPTDQAGILDGAARPGHFRGMATVVMKLFQIVRPHTALFGKKDYQQLMIIRNMVQDFNLPIRIVGGETVRAADGLALSSRNGYLDANQRKEAPRLFEALTKVVAEIRRGNHDFPLLERVCGDELASNGWKVDYIAVRNKIDLQLPPAVHESGLVVLAAARLGSTRLIDNLEV
ncbi:MAG: pantoate--beta-alanine ligase [Proteobacteria bacterium]|nr:pantoate--beta-alanine ligase [Pseudomonadota bacterium]HQR03387.1 pantoate--beta-alanine ligase [Rhodocyclaceae bacterium]